MMSISVSLLFLQLIIAIPGTYQIFTDSQVTCDTGFAELTYSITPVVCPENCWRQSDRNGLCGLDKYSGGSICLAAMQLGLIDNVGGVITVYKNKNVSFKPVGGSRNGVTSHNCSRSKVSYTFDITCGTNGNAMHALNKAVCPPGCRGTLARGRKFFHIHSSVCSAAVHARKVTKAHGGEVTLYRLHDVLNISGLVGNGVVAASGSSDEIFTFDLFNECKLPTKPCQNNASCYDFLCGFHCICAPGYEGKLCDRDINECRLAGTCHANAACNNTKGSFICTCNDGYSGDGKNCGDIDECRLAGTCHANAACYNTKGSFICTCNDGYSGDGKNCSDIDECRLAGTCHANAACYNTKGSFTCNCNNGYSGDGKNCSAFYCDAAPTVSNGGSVTPTLPASPGYHGNTLVTSSCASGFVPAAGANTAECRATNTWNPTLLECTDINECRLAGSCHANANCVNTKGSFYCICKSGFFGDGKICGGIEVCYAGVKDWRVPDSSMTASSVYNNYYLPSNARLDNNRYWIPKNNNAVQWIQVDFGKDKEIFGIVTQGGGRQTWMTRFQIKYSHNGINFTPIAKTFSGNVNYNTQKINRFYPPVTGRYFRLIVIASNNQPGLRLEYLIC